MKKQSLNGIWEYRIGTGTWTTRNVPSSDKPVGHSEYRLSFDRDDVSPRAFLRFDGITYSAKVKLNGAVLGKMLPYCEYTFEVTDVIKDKDNLIEVFLEDIAPVFGPSEGWENYGGIIRDVSVLYGETEYIKDIFFHTALKNDYKDAEYTVDIETDAATDSDITVTLSKNGATVSQYTRKAGDESVAQTVSDVKLWSPENPELYYLTVTLSKGGKIMDERSVKVGFKELSCDEHRFIINGKPTFILGVCRHDIYGNLGHTIPEDLMRRDMQMIKDLGCNFVRLVHYPHNKRIIEIADEIGLLVSEEPGLWWSDTAHPENHDGSLEVMRRTIIRDRSNVSVAFWLSFNECYFSLDYLIDSANLCKVTDPYRLVSGANCMGIEDTIKNFNACGFDFYTMHPYSETLNRINESSEKLCDKPLIFTEWGGYYVQDNNLTLRNFIKRMIALWNRGEDSRLAGACFWEWSELREYGRPDGCVDGVLKEGLVDEERNPNPALDVFKEAWSHLNDVHTPEETYEFELIDKDFNKKALYPADTAPDWQAVMDGIHTPIPRYKVNKRVRRHKVGPKLQKAEVSGISAVPFTVEGTPLEFTGDALTDTVTVVGAVCCKGGYPIAGQYGEVAATLTLLKEGKAVYSTELKNGIDFTTAFSTFGPSRINPVAENTKLFARFSYDKEHEHYIINRLDIPLDGETEFDTVKIQSVNGDYRLLVYGIFV